MVQQKLTKINKTKKRKKIYKPNRFSKGRS